MLIVDKNIKVRIAAKEEGAKYLQVRREILEEDFEETNDEVTVLLDSTIQLFKALIAFPNYHCFLAEHKRQVIGFAHLEIGTLPFNQHNAKLEMGALKSFLPIGVKKKMLTLIDKFAFQKNLRRLETICPQDDFELFALLISLDYKIEGKPKKTILKKTGSTDTYIMAKWL